MFFDRCVPPTDAPTFAPLPTQASSPMSPKPERAQTDQEMTETTEPTAQAAVAPPAQRFDFCPHKDLNLPTSYDEVVKRFKRLQGDRAWEVMN